MMTKEEFIELTGEYPEDMLGGDWENDLEDMKVLKEFNHKIFICSWCKHKFLTAGEAESHWFKEHKSVSGIAQIHISQNIMKETN